MTKDFDGIGLNSMSEAEVREGQGITSKKTKILTPDSDFNFNS